MAGLQYYDFTIAPNQTRELAAEGSYFRYYSGSAGGLDETILIKSDTGGVQTLLRPGQSIKTPANCRTWYLSNYRNASTISGIVVVGNGEIQDSQVAGTVSVVDGGKLRSMAAQAFLGYGSIGASAGLYSMIQLFNPAGSGKNVIVSQICASVSVPANNYIYLRRHSIPFANHLGNAASKNGIGASQAVIKSENAAIPASTGLLLLPYKNALDQIIYKFTEPIVIAQNVGIFLASDTVNSTLLANFEFHEDPI